MDDQKTIPVDEFIQSIKDNEISNPDSGFIDRLEDYKRHMYDFRYEPIKFTIMADGLISFYKVSDEAEGKFLASGLKGKVEVLHDLSELETPDEVISRALQFCNILLYTSMVTKDKFYLYVANRLFYVLSGEPGFLTDIGLSLYNIPVNKKPREIEVPQSQAEGMYQ